MNLLEALDSGSDEALLAGLGVDGFTTYTAGTGSGYARHLERANEYKHEQTRSTQNIGLPPAPADPERRAAAEESLKEFLETYFDDVFTMEWSEDHLRLLEKLERAIIEGELSAVAFPRGGG